MSAVDQMADLARLGIRLEAHGDRLRYSPKAAMTPELAQQVKAHKVALLAILTADDIPAAVLWHAALDSLEGDPEFPPEMLAGCRRASVRWESERPAGDCVNEPTEGEIDPDAPQCDRCGSTERPHRIAPDERNDRSTTRHPSSRQCVRRATRA